MPYLLSMELIHPPTPKGEKVVKAFFWTKNMNKWLEYERLKHKWIANNPNSTASEYESAIRLICRKLGI